MELLEHIYSLSTNHKFCWEDIYCHVHLEQLRIRGKNWSINDNIPSSSTSIRESLLLKLTIIQKLFSRAQEFSCSKLLELCNYIVDELNLLEDLLLCLRCEDQLTAFSASKALSNVLVLLPLTSKNKMWFYTFLDFQTLKAKTCPWRLLYTFPVLSHLFRCYHSNISRHKRTCICQTSSERFDGGNIRAMTVYMVSYVSNKLESLIFASVPLWKEFTNMTEILSDSVEENKEVGNAGGLFRALCVHVHEEKIDCCPIQPGIEDNFLAILMLLAEVLTCMATSAEKRNITDLAEGSSVDEPCFPSDKLGEDQTSLINNSASPDEAVYNSKMVLEDLDSSGDSVSNIANPSSLGKIFPLLVHCLHLKHLSHITFKKIFDIISQVLLFAGGNLATGVKGSSGTLEKAAMVTARSFISVFSCCIWENLPKCGGFLGFGGRKVQRPVGFSEPMRNYQCVDRVALRKVSLVILRTLVLLSNCEMNEDSKQVMREVIGTLSSWVENMQEAVSKITQYSAENLGVSFCQRESDEQNLQVALFDLFSDQDDELVELLQLLLTLYQRIQKSKRIENDTAEPHTEDTVIHTICHQINPHTFFVNFLRIVCFDHSVILDFLVSTETVFLSYLVSYLRCILNNWSAFVYSHKTGSADGPCEADDIQLTSEEEEDDGNIFQRNGKGDIQTFVDDLKSPTSFGTFISTAKNAMVPFASPKSEGHNCEVPEFLSPISVMLFEEDNAGLKRKGDSQREDFNTDPKLVCSTVVADHLIRKGKMHDKGRLEAEEDSDKITTSSGALYMFSLAYDDDDDGGDDDYDDAFYPDSYDRDHKDDTYDNSGDYGNGVCGGDDRDEDGCYSIIDGDDDGHIDGGGGGGGGDDDDVDDDGDDDVGNVDDDDGNINDDDGQVGGGGDGVDVDDDDDDDDDSNGGDIGDDDRVVVDDSKGGDVGADSKGKDEFAIGDEKVDHIDGGDSYGDDGSNHDGEDEQMQFGEFRNEKFNCFDEGAIAASHCVSTSFPTDSEDDTHQPVDVIDTVPESLEKTMSVLIRLRLSIERLATVGLFPYSPGPLLRLMERVEQFYDDC